MTITQGNSSIGNPVFFLLSTSLKTEIQAAQTYTDTQALPDKSSLKNCFVPKENIKRLAKRMALIHL